MERKRVRMRARVMATENSKTRMEEKNKLKMRG